MAVCIALIITNLLNIFFEFFKRSLSILLWGILFIIFTVPHIVHYSTGNVSKGVLNEAGLFVVIFNLIYLISRSLLDKKIRNNLKNRVLNFNKIFFKKDRIIDIEKLTYENGKLINFYFYIYIISILVLFLGVIVKGYSIFNFTWLDGVNYERNFIEKVANFAMLGFSGIGFITITRKDKFKFILASLAYIIFVLFSRSRYYIIPFIIPFLIHNIYSEELKKIFKSIIIGVCILFSVFLLQQIRYAGSLDSLISNYTITDILQNTVNFIKNGKGEFSLSRVFYYFVENNNDFNNFEEGRTYIRLALLPLPSSIFTFKPRDFAMDMWEAWHGMKTTVGTMHPTLYGDVYANFGFIGIFMGIFYALFVKGTDLLMNKVNDESKKILYISILSTMYILLARGAVYNSIANAFWEIVIINLIIFLINVIITNLQKFRK